MKLLLLLLTALSLTSVQGRDLTSDLPFPWLTVDHLAKVLHLLCKPPPKVSWEAVHDLILTKREDHRRESSNISLVTMTSNMAAPKVNDLFPVHNVSFQGDWRTTDVSLDFAFPVTDQDLGRFFCTVFYADTDHQLSSLTSEIVVDQNFVSNHLDNQPKIVDGFSAEIFDAHHVNVTWKKPNSDKFTTASVSRRLVYKKGNGVEPLGLLYTTDRDSHLKDRSVVLNNFSDNGRGNMSLTLYIKSGSHRSHSLSYRYSCLVPYPACHGDHEPFCTCCQMVENPDTELCPIPPKESSTFLHQGSPSNPTHSFEVSTTGPEQCESYHYGLVGTSIGSGILGLIVFGYTVYCICKHCRCCGSACCHNRCAKKQGGPEEEPFVAIKHPEGPMPNHAWEDRNSGRQSPGAPASGHDKNSSSGTTTQGNPLATPINNEGGSAEDQTPPAGSTDSPGAGNDPGPHNDVPVQKSHVGNGQPNPEDLGCDPST